MPYLTLKTVYSDPYSSWQKGAVENANKPIRQYMTKGTDFKETTNAFIKKSRLNARPREKLNFSTPKCEFFKHFC